MKKILAQTPVQISQGIALLLVEKIQSGTLSFSEQFTLLDGIKHSLEPKVIETVIRKLANEGADKALYAILSYVTPSSMSKCNV